MVLGLGGDGGGRSITLLGTIISWAEGARDSVHWGVQQICRDITRKLFHGLFKASFATSKKPIDLSGVRRRRENINTESHTRLLQSGSFTNGGHLAHFLCWPSLNYLDP